MTKQIRQPDESLVDVVAVKGGALSEVGLISANFTRPADNTAYASGDLVANNTTAGSVTPMTFTAGRVDPGNFCIRRAKIKKSNATLTNAQFRLHLYSTLPTVANGDNAAFSSIEAGYLGAIDVTVDQAFSTQAAGFGVPNKGSEINVALASGQAIYGLLEARAGYGGAAANAEVFTVTLEAWQN